MFEMMMLHTKEAQEDVRPKLLSHFLNALLVNCSEKHALADLFVNQVALFAQQELVSKIDFLKLLLVPFVQWLQKNQTSLLNNAIICCLIALISKCNTSKMYVVESKQLRNIAAALLKVQNVQIQLKILELLFRLSPKDVAEKKRFYFEKLKLLHHKSILSVKPDKFDDLARIYLDAFNEKNDGISKYPLSVKVMKLEIALQTGEVMVLFFYLD
jgi:hypothetical protein